MSETLIDLVTFDTVYSDFEETTGITALLDVDGVYQMAAFPSSGKWDRLILGEFACPVETADLWQKITGRVVGVSALLPPCVRCEKDIQEGQDFAKVHGPAGWACLHRSCCERAKGKGKV